MTEQAPITESTSTTGGTPEFAVVVRGYDRDQVDSYVTELLGLVAQLRRELLDLRQEQASESTDPLTQQVVVEPDSSPLWEGSGPEVARLLERAEVAATARLERAEEDAKAIIEGAERQHDQAAAELEELRGRWRDLVAQLEQVLTTAKDA